MFAVSLCVCGKGGYFQQQSDEGSSMTQRRRQGPLWEHCGWLRFAEPARATESADSLTVLIWAPGSAPYLERHEVSCPDSEHRRKT